MKQARPRIKKIHVNQHMIRKNRNDNEDNPIFTVKSGKENHYGHEVLFLGPGKLVYSPCKPMSCGAVAWLETTATVKVLLRDKDGSTNIKEVQ